MVLRPSPSSISPTRPPGTGLEVERDSKHRHPPFFQYQIIQTKGERKKEEDTQVMQNFSEISLFFLANVTKPGSGIKEFCSWDRWSIVVGLSSLFSLGFQSCFYEHILYLSLRLFYFVFMLVKFEGREVMIYFGLTGFGVIGWFSFCWLFNRLNCAVWFFALFCFV